MLSLLWLVCSIGLVTAGPATAALYDTVVHVLRRKEDTLFARFFRTFRAELRVGCLSALLWLGIAALLLLSVLCRVFPLLSRFTFGPAELNRTALRLALGNVLRSFAAALLTALGALASLLFLAPLFFVPALLVWLWSFLMEPVFARYET